jgi:HK97 family phage portal protein
MRFIDRILEPLRHPPGAPPMFAPIEQRSYVVGNAAVRVGEERWGHDDADFSPPEYLDYIATSNNVYTCVTRRANALASLPLVLYKGQKKDSRKEVETGNARTLLDSVNPWMTFDRLIHLTEQYLCLTGEAFWFLERGKSKTRPPTEIWPVRPDWVKIVPHTRDFISGFLLFPPDGGEPIPYSTDEVIWFAYPNPLDPYSGLAPLAAARLAADTAQAAMQSNRAIFSNGTQLGGVLSPADNGAITPEQAKRLQDDFKRGFKGVANAHRLAILDFAVKYQQWTMTPKDAEFLGALDLTLEEIARAFGIAPDLLGGSKRTYQNAPEARYAFWADTIASEARFVQSVITERLLPMVGTEADVAEFSFDDVDALKENEDAKWKREQEQIASGVMLHNEWRADHGLAPVPYGDDWWAQSTLVPIGGPMAAEAEQAKQDAAEAIAQQMQQPPPEAEDTAQDQPNGPGGAERSRRHIRAVEFGSAEHERLWTRAAERAEPWEQRVGDTVVGLMRRQKQAILANLRQQEIRSEQRLAIKDLLETIFALPRWIREFRTTIRPVLAEIVRDAGEANLNDLGLTASFNLSDPNVVRALERQAQRFAVSVNSTTWDDLRAALSEGIEAGEGIDDLARRVERVMGNRIRSSGEVVARTEVSAASTIGSIESARQSGVVAQKEWLATFDARVRDTHAAAHGQRVGLDENFRVGDAMGPGPGMMSKASESIQCRCSLRFVTDVEASEPRAVVPNGHVTLVELAQALGVRT